MKKKIIIPIISLILIIGIICVFSFKKDNIVTITLDINPSIEIKMKKDKVIDIIPLNKDAENIINDKLKNKSLDEVLDRIVEKLIEQDYTRDNQVVIVMHIDGKINEKDLENKIRTSFKDINVELIKIDKITKEDNELAKKYNITPAKASYINSIVKENKNISVNSLINKSVKELRETESTGNYCDQDYFLEGNRCFKEISREKAKRGDVCPDKYSEYEGTCYKNEGIKESDKLVCPDDFTLKNKKCVKVEEVDADAEYTCDKGEILYERDGITKCGDTTGASKPTQRCLTINHTMIDGKCADGPKPTIDGGCEAGDYLVNGGCYTMDNEDQWVCPDGGIYHRSQNSVPEYCPDTLTFKEPKIKGYKCREGFTLKDNKCVREEVIDPFHERYCDEGYSLVNDASCIKLDDTKEKEDGFFCDQENTRLIGDECVTYDIVDSKHK